MSHVDRSHNLRFVVIPSLLFLILGSAAGGASAASSSKNSAADFLYQLAREYRRSGQLEDAIHELHKALLIDPDYTQASRELEAVQSLRRELREQAIGKVLAEIERQRADHVLGGFIAETGAEPQEAAAPIVSWEKRRSPLPVRVPDPDVNGVRWFYVFGRWGNPDYGALAAPQDVFVEVPRSDGGPVGIRILDADTRGRRDEMDDGWNTSTAFRVFGGSTLLDSRVIGPEFSDGTTVEFGPFTLDQGEPRGDEVLFRVEAEGLEGDDNNLFALEVHPSSAQCFSYKPSIRLAEESGTEMRFFPSVPEGTARITEANYDLDPDGGRASLTALTPAGRAVSATRLSSSGSGAWSATEVDVPPGADGARWAYRIAKGTQRKANMAFRVADQSGSPLPIYTTKGSTKGWTLGTSRAPEAAAAPRRSCNTFTFDASTSYDPDDDQLSYAWEFGDGTTADGMRVTHTYDTAGDYRVILKVTDTSTKACGTSSTEQIVHVNTPPNAVLEGPSFACAGTGVRFSGTQSSDSPTEPLSYRWDFGDGTTAEGAEVTHAYARGGTYMAQLVVDDGRGTSCSADVATTAVRINSPPVAKANDAVAMCARSADEPLAVSLSAMESGDPDFDALTYRWNFGDGAQDEGLWVSHTYARGGRYAATVTVDDGSGTACSSATATVPVQVNHAPQAVVSPMTEGCLAEPMTFNASRSTDPDGDALTYRWEFGDGQTGQGASTQYRYPAHGRFPVTLTIDDGSGMMCSTSTATALAHVNAPPVAQMAVFGEEAAPPAR